MPLPTTPITINLKTHRMASVHFQRSSIATHGNVIIRFTTIDDSDNALIREIIGVISWEYDRSWFPDVLTQPNQGSVFGIVNAFGVDVANAQTGFVTIEALNDLYYPEPRTHEFALDQQGKIIIQEST